MELTEIKRIGEKTAEKLMEHGIKTAEELAQLRPEELKDIVGLDSVACKEIIMDAKNKALDNVFQVKTLAQIQDHQKNVVKRISTGSMTLDSLLKGGIPTDAITMISGAFSTGKTQMCYQLAINCIKLGKKVAWIETESGTFVVDRIMELAKCSKVDIDMEKDFTIIDAHSIEDAPRQYLAYEMMRKRCQGVDLGLFVVDSFSAKFRSTYSRRENLPQRAAEEARHFGLLDTIASQFNCAVVLTNQIMDIPDQSGQIAARVKTGTVKEIYGGNVVKHSATMHIMLNKIKMDEWECIVFDAPNIPFSKASFRITPMGIRDIVAR